MKDKIISKNGKFLSSNIKKSSVNKNLKIKCKIKYKTIIQTFG